MPRIRSIKPETWADEKLAALPRDARLLFIGLWNFADDSGRLRGSPALIRAQVFPYDSDVDVDTMLQKLHDSRFVQRYAVNGESLLWVVNFNKHQKIDKPSKSALPPPPIEFAEASPKPPRSLAVGVEGNGEDRKGRTEGAKPETAPASAQPGTPLLAYLAREFVQAKARAEHEAAWKEAYPGIDLLAEAKKARAWELSNPKKIKTQKRRFLSAWFARAQDTQPNRTEAPGMRQQDSRPHPPPVSEMETHEEREKRLWAEAEKAIRSANS